MKIDKHYTINRKDGITYEKTYHVNGYDANVHFRYYADKVNVLKEFAKEDKKSLNTLYIEIFDEYIKSRNLTKYE